MDYGLEENVSLITFGGDQARVEQHLTNEFQCLRSKLGDQHKNSKSFKKKINQKKNKIAKMCSIIF